MQVFPQPEPVFRYFSAVSAIPRGSGNTAGIQEWCLDTAAKLGITAYADNSGNVILKKSAAPGYESHTPVILQGHLDMVCAKLPDCPVCMDTEPPKLIWGEEYISADGTTLGGDDGIAVAYAFALLEQDDIPHPQLTIILTNDEETGMDGASGLSPDELTGKMLINLDSENEGVMTVGCAGGVRVHLTVPFPSGAVSGTLLTLKLHGLTGGHSGTEIHKRLLNANIVMRDLLTAIRSPFRIAEWNGGMRDNVIPTDCTASLFCGRADKDDICRSVLSELSRLLTDYPAESDAKLEIRSQDDASGTGLTAQAAASFLRFMQKLPNGVTAMNSSLNMPETSLNIGIASLRSGTAQVDALIRSSINSEKDALTKRLIRIAESSGGTAELSGSYPAWEYRPDTELEQTAVRVFKKLYGTEPKTEIIHAGLECGILCAKKPGLQCISIGPDLFDVHTPRERLSIASAARTWEYLLALLSAL